MKRTWAGEAGTSGRRERIFSLPEEDASSIAKTHLDASGCLCWPQAWAELQVSWWERVRERGLWSPKDPLWAPLLCQRLFPERPACSSTGGAGGRGAGT